VRQKVCQEFRTTVPQEFCKSYQEFLIESVLKNRGDREGFTKSFARVLQEFYRVFQQFYSSSFTRGLQEVARSPQRVLLQELLAGVQRVFARVLQNFCKRDLQVVLKGFYTSLARRFTRCWAKAVVSLLETDCVRIGC
jgi:hypothetical protein